MKEQENLFQEKENLYKEFLGKKLMFFDENDELTEFKVRRISNNCFVLRKKENGRIIEVEVPIIEVLTLNFPDSEKYIFSQEEWENFWKKYGGYIPPQVKIDKPFLSIKEARNIFSKLPSEFEKILIYFLFPNDNVYKIILDIDNKETRDINIKLYLEDYTDPKTIKKILYLMYLLLKGKKMSPDDCLKLERRKSEKRKQFFGRIPEIELWKDEEKTSSKEQLGDLLKNLFKIRNYFVLIDQQIYDKLKKIEEKLANNGILIGRSSLSFFNEFISFYLNLNIIKNISTQEIKLFLLILMLKRDFLNFDDLIQSSDPVEVFILKIFLIKHGLGELIKSKPQFIILPTTNPTPLAFLYRNLLKHCYKILKKSNHLLAEQIIPPKFILFDFINRPEILYFIENKIGNQIVAIYFLNLFKQHSLNEIIEKAKRNEFKLEKENLDKLFLIIKNVQILILKISKYKNFDPENINNINDLKNLLNEIKFLDDVFSSGYTYYYSMFIFYLALIEIFRQKINPDEIYNAFKERFLIDFKNVSQSLSNPEEFNKAINKVAIFTGTDFLRELIPFSKLLKKDQENIDYTFTYYPGFRYQNLEKYFTPELLKTIVESSKLKIEILKKIAKALVPDFIQMITSNPQLFL